MSEIANLRAQAARNMKCEWIVNGKNVEGRLEDESIDYNFYIINFAVSP